MSIFTKVMLMTITALFIAMTGAANAEQSGKATELKALTHGVVTEGYYYQPQMKGLSQVMANRAFVYGNPENLKKVVYNKEMRGPINKKAPWVGTEADRFKKTESFLSGIFQRLVSGELVDPRLETAWHFDMRRHKDWGRELAMYCDPTQKKGCIWFYESRNKDVAAKLRHWHRASDPVRMIASN